MDNHRTLPKRGTLFALALVAAFAVLVGVFSCPTQAQASECYVQDTSGNVTYYDHFEDGKKAAYGKGKTLVMMCNIFNEQIIGVDGGQDLTIDMKGYQICYLGREAGGGFHLYPNSSLTLTSTVREVPMGSVVYLTGTESHYSMDWANFVSGGLVTMGDDSYGFNGAAIYMEAGCHLTLDDITVSGNSALGSKGAGVYAEKNCTIDLKSKASIRNNGAEDYGGGIYIDGDNCTVTLDDSSIHDNIGKLGGGIYSDGSGTKVYLLNGSEIYGNEAQGGGGVYFNKTDFVLSSPDKTGSIRNNIAYESSTTTSKGSQSGGGIHVDQKSGENEGLIENLTIKDNYSAYDGGAIELDQRWTTVRNCTITGNTSGCEGGAIYVCNNKNIIDNCTIMNNACDLENKGYEGGGVFVWHDYDIRLSNVCVIKGNTRGKNTTNYDDVMLRENGGATAKAYIVGNLKEGSAVGVRTGTTGDRRVAKDFSYANKSCLFADLDGYYVSFGTDAGGDAWQRHSTIEYTSTIDGAGITRHKANSTVTLAAPAAAAGKTFWHWGTDGATGLLPVDYYISTLTMYSPTLTLKMPQNDINVTTVYADTVEKVEISGFKAPAVGEELPTTATLARSDSKKNGGTEPVEAKVTWYKVRSDGARYIVSGTADAGDTYYAVFSIEQSVTAGRFFSTSMAAANVTLRASSATGEQVAAPASAKVDAATGTLTVQSAEFNLPKPEKPSSTTTKTASAEILRQWEDAVKKAKEKYQKKDEAEGNEDTGSNNGEKSGDGSESQVAALADEVDGAKPSGRGEIDSVQFEYTYDEGNEGNATATIAAPCAEGYSFRSWEGVPEGWEVDDAAGTVTVAADALNEFTESGGKLSAIYAPAVTKVEVALDAPAAGAKLAETCGEIKATSCDADEPVSLSADGGFKVTWSPEAKTAAYGTAYTALIELCGGEGAEDLERVLAQNAVVTCNGTSATSAGVVETEGKLCLALSFPATKNDAAASVAAPADVELSFEEAAGYAAEQLNYTDEVCWPLPRTVAVTLASGQVVDGDVVWDIPDGFDEGATAAQELRIKGYVYHIATGKDAEIYTDNDLLEVEVTVKVAAPEKESDGAGKKDDGGSNNAGKTSDEQSDNGEQKVAGQGSAAASSQAASQTKKATPATGDAAAPVAGLLAAAIASLGAARLSRRRL